MIIVDRPTEATGQLKSQSETTIPNGLSPCANNAGFRLQVKLRQPHSDEPAQTDVDPRVRAPTV
jgi:hypothetical protein